MKHLTFVTLAIAASLFVVEASPLTPEQTLDRRAIGDLEFSPDGSRLVFTVTEPVTGAARARAIWVLDIGSGRARPLTFSGKSDGSPRWAPDGSAIAFTSDREGPSQLYRLSMRGQTRPWSSHKAGCDAPSSARRGRSPECPWKPG